MQFPLELNQCRQVPFEELDSLWSLDIILKLDDARGTFQIDQCYEFALCLHYIMALFLLEYF